MTRQTRSGRAGLIAGCLTALFLNGCGANSYQPTTPPPVAQPSPTPTPIPTPAPSVVVIEVVAINGNMSFVPATANLQVGQQVRWHNAHSVSHTATQDRAHLPRGHECSDHGEHARHAQLSLRDPPEHGGRAQRHAVIPMASPKPHPPRLRCARHQVRVELVPELVAEGWVNRAIRRVWP